MLRRHDVDPEQFQVSVQPVNIDGVEVGMYVFGKLSWYDDNVDPDEDTRHGIWRVIQLNRVDDLVVVRDQENNSLEKEVSFDYLCLNDIDA